MWLIGGSKTKTRKVKDGRTGQRFCGDCRRVVVFHEHDVTDKIHAFFVELFEHTQRRMVCSECGEDHDVEEFFAAAIAAPAAKAALPRPSPARLAEPAKRAAPPKKPDADVDEMLAALKRKMAKQKDE
jgi:hypothetical protein